MRFERKLRDELTDKDIEMVIQTMNSGKLIIIDILFLSAVFLFMLMPPRSPFYYYPIVFALLFFATAGFFAFLHWLFVNFLRKKA